MVYSWQFRNFYIYYFASYNWNSRFFDYLDLIVTKIYWIGPFEIQWVCNE